MKEPRRGRPLKDESKDAGLPRTVPVNQPNMTVWEKWELPASKPIARIEYRVLEH